MKAQSKLETRACRVQDTQDTRAHGVHGLMEHKTWEAQEHAEHEARGKYSMRACEAHNLADSYFTNF